MWAYKAWQGLHFPAHLARREQLGVYASWSNAVEGNTTFYGLPAPRTVASWAAEAPDGFRFVFKLPRAITHEHHLRDVAADHRQFLERIAPLGDRAEHCRSSSHHRSDPATWTRWQRSSSCCRRRIATPSSCATTPSTTTRTSKPTSKSSSVH